MASPHPFGDDVPDNPVKPTYFDPCAGYSPRDKTFKRRPSDGKWLRTDQIADEQRQKEKQTVPTTALAVKDDTSIAVTPEQLDLIKRTVANGATADELKLYLFDCARQGVHPLDKLVHFTKRAGKYTPITSIDFMRIRAAETNEYAGSDDATFKGDPEEKLPPVSATVTVWRLVQGTRCQFTATARWSEYKPDQNDFMWKKMPHTMLGKCAEACALRKGFPRQLHGLYAKEEMDQAGAAQSGYVVSTPARSEAREKPAAATVGNRGTSPRPSIENGRAFLDSPDQEGHAEIRDSVTGAVLSDDGPDLGAADIELPEGFRLIDDYKLDGDWHQVTWGRDAMGGWMTFKTKLAKIGLAAHNAFTEKMPVRLHSNKPPYLDRVEPLGSTIPQIKASKFNPDDDRFCDECNRPTAACICK